MSFAKLAGHAMSLPGTTQDIKWGADWVSLTHPKALPLAELQALVAAGLTKKLQREPGLLA
jgi:hypothetical protein